MSASTWQDDVPTCADYIENDAHRLAADLTKDFGTDYVRALRHLWTGWRTLPDPYEEAVQRECSAILLAACAPVERVAWLKEWRQEHAVAALVRAVASRHLRGSSRAA